jgi:hypothetical protein
MGHPGGWIGGGVDAGEDGELPVVDSVGGDVVGAGVVRVEAGVGGGLSHMLHELGV